MAKDYVLYGGNTGKSPPALDKIDLDVDQPRYTRYGHASGVRMRRPVRKQSGQDQPGNPDEADNRLTPHSPQPLRAQPMTGGMHSARPWGVFKDDGTPQPVAMFTGLSAEADAGAEAVRLTNLRNQRYVARLADAKPREVKDFAKGSDDQPRDDHGMWTAGAEHNAREAQGARDAAKEHKDQADYHRDQVNKPYHPNARGHAAAESAHLKAWKTYEQAAQHYEAGRTEVGNRVSDRANSTGNAAFRMSRNLPMG